MERKKLFLMIAVAAMLVALMALVLIAGAAWYLRGRQSTPTPEPAQISLCDVNASGICVVSFGVNELEQMLINLRLPGDDYPAMYAMVKSRNISTRYPCQFVEDARASLFCTGPKTPLSEAITLTLLASNSDIPIAQGTFIVTALALPTHVSFTLAPEDLTNMPLETATLFLPPQPGATQTTQGTPRTPAGTLPTVTGGTPGATSTRSITPTGTITPPTATTTPTPTYTRTP